MAMLTGLMGQMGMSQRDYNQWALAKQQLGGYNQWTTAVTSNTVTNADVSYYGNLYINEMQLGQPQAKYVYPSKPVTMEPSVTTDEQWLNQRVADICVRL